MKKYFSVLIVLAMSFSAQAYIPKVRTILDKTAKKHGEAIYAIQQEVIFRNDQETAVILESWVVANGEAMFMEAKGAGFRFVNIYKDHTRHFVNEQGSEAAVTVSSDFAENLLHHRNLAGLGSALVKLNLLSPRALEGEPTYRSSKEVRHNPEASVRLGRTAGIIAYTFGTPTPVDAVQALPGLWIEQDHFFIRKLRFPSTAEMIADEYQEYPKNFWFPKTRTITWGNNGATVRTARVSVVAPKDANAQKTNPQWLRKQKAEFVSQQVSNSPLAPVIKEFYSRFR